MKIKLNDKYQVIGTRMNFVLEEKKIHGEGKEKGMEHWDAVGFYPTLESLLRGLFRYKLQETETEGIENIIEEIRVNTRIIMGQIKLLQEEAQPKEAEAADENN